MDSFSTPSGRRARRSTRVGLAVAAIAVTAASAVGVAGLVHAAPTHKRPNVPQDSEVEGKSGIRIVRVSLAGDGGLLDVRYIVLNPSLATEWTGDTNRPPVIDNLRTHESFDRVAAMREGHDLRPGQTYYLIYLNKGGDVKRGDKIDITIAGTVLKGVPVE
jgi:hypothetical protein